MKTLIVCRNIILSIFTMIGLVCGLEGVSDAAAAPTVEPKDDNTTLEISVSDSLLPLYIIPPMKAYEFQWRRKALQGNWQQECATVVIRFLRSGGFFTFAVTISELEPGTT